MRDAEEVVTFWFSELEPSRWFVRDDAVDREIRTRFSDVYEMAAACELFTWRRSAEGRLAEIIVLDQFARNLFRDDARAFAADPLALALAQECIGIGADVALTSTMRGFVYMPFMHSESLRIHDEAERLFSQPGMEQNLDFERRHKRIIERFGRYPHRNVLLDRPSTEQEKEFLAGPDSSF